MVSDVTCYATVKLICLPRVADSESGDFLGATIGDDSNTTYSMV